MDPCQQNEIEPLLSNQEPVSKKKLPQALRDFRVNPVNLEKQRAEFRASCLQKTRLPPALRNFRVQKKINCDIN